MTNLAGPTVVRRQLGRILKRHRTAAGVSVDQLVANPGLGISRAKLYRLEAGQHPVKPQDVTVLCQYLQVPQDEIARLTGMALATQSHHDGAIPEWFELYRDLEQVASTISVYEGEVIPGEFQTADYARAVFVAGGMFDTDDAIDEQVSLRLQRQERLFGRTSPPRFTAVINESALLRPVGGPDVLKGQIERLHQLIQDRIVDIRVLTLSVGAHAAMEGAFRMLDFDDPDDPDIVYLEAPVGGRYLQKRQERAVYDRIWRRLYQQSVPLEEVTP